MYAIEEHVEHTVASTVLMRDYKAADKTYCLSEWMKPYTLVASTCVSAILPWATRAGEAPSEIAYYFEDGDADQSDVMRCWDREFPHYEIRPLFLKKRDTHPSSGVCAPIRPFEATDFIAYENLKANIKADRSGNIFFDDLRKPFQRLGRLPGASEWRRTGLEELDSICSHYKVSKRSSPL